jgi:hypothetical protein
MGSTVSLRKCGTFLDGRCHLTIDKSTTPSLPRAQEKTLHSIIVVGNPESVLPDVLAIHTIEMIPKSMILTLHQLPYYLWLDIKAENGVLTKQIHF